MCPCHGFPALAGVGVRFLDFEEPLVLWSLVGPADQRVGGKWGSGDGGWGRGGRKGENEEKLASYFCSI